MNTYKATVTRKGIRYHLGHHDTRKGADVACRLFRHWMDLGYDPEHCKGLDRCTVKLKRILYRPMPGVKNIYVKIEEGFDLRFGFRFRHANETYQGYGYDSLAKCVRTLDNKRKALGLTKEGE